jgi:hypothetical protein
VGGITRYFTGCGFYLIFLILMIWPSFFKLMHKLLALGLFLLFFGCKNPEEKLTGKWNVTNYTFHGADSMAQLTRRHQNTFITFQDRGPDAMGKWGISRVEPDTVYNFGGNWELTSKNEIRFDLEGVLISSGGWLAGSWNINTNPGDPPFQFVLGGVWDIEKQGEYSLQLAFKADNEIKIQLQRQKF